jgi:hypothetical protein
MTQNQTLPKKNALYRKSGSVSLFISDGSPQGFAAQPYSRFRICRGFIDDLNRLLPIRMRIHLEVEIGRGRSDGLVESPQLRFRWEFLED